MVWHINPFCLTFLCHLWKVNCKILWWRNVVGGQTKRVCSFKWTDDISFYCPAVQPGRLYHWVAHSTSRHHGGKTDHQQPSRTPPAVSCDNSLLMKTVVKLLLVCFFNHIVQIFLLWIVGLLFFTHKTLGPFTPTNSKKGWPAIILNTMTTKIRRRWQLITWFA